MEDVASFIVGKWPALVRKLQGIYLIFGLFLT